MQQEIRQHPFKINPNMESSACFRRGTCIELSTGVLRRVEDLRTEDFIQSALRSQHFDLKEATVVKIDRTSTHINNITFSYDTQHMKVHMEVASAHPLFVYGQGWASCNPQLSFELYELKCQQLQVGDICLSLVAHEQPPPAPELHPTPLDVPYAFEANCQAAALPKHPYQVYAEMANLVAAYTQHLMGKMK
ncbi:ataxin-1-like [Drosophila novamexicana]|uniref:ataxin-1-like n=1 Tax=Drosophila novamexicana TaxID=47314 RepID=UPI0011E5F0FD|nr:ataxin-1-like [Drosophila novamexicana]